jgi:hypothetical protein
VIDDRKTRSPARREEPPEPPARQRWQPRFGLGTMMLVMLVCGMMSSAGYYLVRGNMTQTGEGGGGSQLQLVFILITLASPLLVAAGISLVLQATRYIARRRPPAKPKTPE